MTEIPNCCVQCITTGSKSDEIVLPMYGADLNCGNYVLIFSV